MDNSSVQTLDDLITYGTTSDFSTHLISLFAKEGNYIFLDSLVYDKYSQQINAVMQQITLTDDQWRVYRYKPDLMSSILYDTPLLKHLVLFMNGGSAHKFNRKIINLIPPSEITNLIQNIILHENTRIQRNRTQILTS